MKRGRMEKFYVFYDDADFVRCFGTPRQLVGEGSFPTINAVHSVASKIKSGKYPGTVAVLTDKGGCAVYVGCAPQRRRLSGV